MPRMDGTGPQGLGALTGRGLGVCAGTRGTGNFGYNRGSGYGRGLGCGRGLGYGRGLGLCRRYVNTDHETLESEKAFLQNRLAAIDEQLRKS